MAAFDRFNEDWVDAASFFSPALIIELLRITGDWTYRWYSSVDPNEAGETIHWISPTDLQPYWLLGAREYLERWIHHLQIRRAVGQPGLTEESASLLPRSRSRSKDSPEAGLGSRQK